MCRQDPRVHLSPEEQIAAEESLSIYCKPVELYNILQRRAVRNVTFLLLLSLPMTNAQLFMYLFFQKRMLSTFLYTWMKWYWAISWVVTSFRTGI